MTTTTLNPPSRLVFKRWPQDHDELHLFTEVVFGITVPRTRICPDHVAPFDALAEAFFAEHPVTVWHGSRGFGGKSFTLALLSVLEATILGADVTILGGSGAQSMRVYQHMLSMWHAPYAPKEVLDGDPTRYVTTFRNGNTIVALMASQASVRGPHPQRLRMDEVDEMDLAIFDAAQGQPMTDSARRPGVQTQTVASSTWQYPDGTMSEIIKRAAKKGWPVRTWCWKETSNPADGWLPAEEIERKRAEVSQAMWEVEYDLQEPSIEGRAFNTDAVNRYFDTTLGEYEGRIDEEITLAEPDPAARYVTSVDWAKTKDWTIIRTFRSDVRPWQEVAFLRTGRKPWPEMVDHLTRRWQKYGGLVWHDATGLGAVVDDYLPVEMKDAKVVTGVQMVGRTREELFSEYVSAVEHDELRTARIEFSYNEHKYASQDDFRSGRTGHPPDSCVAGALAWRARTTLDRITASDILVEDFVRESSPWEIG